MNGISNHVARVYVVLSKWLIRLELVSKLKSLELIIVDLIMKQNLHVDI